MVKFYLLKRSSRTPRSKTSNTFAVIHYVCVSVYVYELGEGWVLVSFPVAVIEHPDRGNIKEKGFIWLTILIIVHHCGGSQGR